jgi:hypothetical protein
MKDFKRQLTPFICHEMLYEYSIGALDEKRRRAIEEFLKTDAEGRKILEALQGGVRYVEALAKTDLKPEFLAHLSESENALSLGRKYSSWRTWPETLRWSITAIIISASVASVVAAVPWTSLNFLKLMKAPESVELAQIPGGGMVNLETQGATAVAKADGIAADEGDESGDDGAGEEETDVGGQAAAVGNAQSHHLGSHDGEEVPLDEELHHAVAPAKVPAVGGVQPGPQVSAAADASALQEKKEAKPKGFVYRAFMNLHDLDTVGPKITDEIRGLGGEKAGEVELGWKRGAGRYYHFALPETNEERLMEKLRAYGPVRISKDPHPRVMPSGQVRFILWVESSD